MALSAAQRKLLDRIRRQGELGYLLNGNEMRSARILERAGYILTTYKVAVALK